MRTSCSAGSAGRPTSRAASRSTRTLRGGRSGASRSGLGLSLEDAARGIVAITNNNMARSIRVVTVNRGLDPRDFTLVPFGGAGPLHAAELAEALGIRRVLVPIAPGVTSGLGCLYVDILHDVSEARIVPVDACRSRRPPVDLRPARIDDA